MCMIKNVKPENVKTKKQDCPINRDFKNWLSEIN